MPAAVKGSFVSTVEMLRVSGNAADFGGKDGTAAVPAPPPPRVPQAAGSAALRAARGHVAEPGTGRRRSTVLVPQLRPRRYRPPFPPSPAALTCAPRPPPAPLGALRRLRQRFCTDCPREPAPRR